MADIARASGEAEAPLFLRLSDRFEHYAGVLSYMRKVYMCAERWPQGEWPGDPFASVFSA